MIITYKSLSPFFVNTSDAENDRIKGIISLNTETMEAIQHVIDEDGNYVINEARDGTLKRTIKLKPPLLITCKSCDQDIFRDYKEDCVSCLDREVSIKQYNQKLTGA